MGMALISKEERKHLGAQITWVLLRCRRRKHVGGKGKGKRAGQANGSKIEEEELDEVRACMHACMGIISRQP